MKATKKKTILISLLALFILTVGGYLAYSAMNTNYAHETAKPLEEALRKAGAMKLCDGGDAGRGPDSKTPYYGSTFKIRQGEAEAIKTAYEVAAKNGFSLIHATPENKGFLNYLVGDDHIDNWYFDESSKDVSHADLMPGKVQLSVVVYGEGSKNDCDQSIVSAGESTIGIGIRLPEFK